MFITNALHPYTARAGVLCDVPKIALGYAPPTFGTIIQYRQGWAGSQPHAYEVIIQDAFPCVTSYVRSVIFPVIYHQLENNRETR